MHVNPDLLALLALDEPIGSDDHEHLSSCASCQDDLAAFRSVVSLGRSTSGEDTLLTPPPEVWDRISDELGLTSSARRPAGNPVNGSAATATTPASSSSAASPAAASPARSAEQADLASPSVAVGGGSGATRSGQPSSSRGLRAASLALAAALALVVGIGLGANLDRLLPGRTEKASTQLNALPAWPGSTGRAVVEEDRDGNRTLVVTISSPIPANGPREVWLTTSTADPMVAVGFLRDDSSGRFPIPPDIDIADYYLVDVSQEPAQDADPHHSGNSMLRGKLPV